MFAAKMRFSRLFREQKKTKANDEFLGEFVMAASSFQIRDYELKQIKSTCGAQLHEQIGSWGFSLAKQN